MSFLPSLLLYNPLEAFIILLFCNVCSGTKTKTRIILDSYILGALNFVVQLIFILYKGKCLYEKVSQKDGCKFC